MNKVSDDAIQGLLQDLGEIATGTAMELGNGELWITEANASDWYRLHAELDVVFDKLASLIERSKEPDPTPYEYERPIFGVSNGRGRIIA